MNMVPDPATLAADIVNATFFKPTSPLPRPIVQPPSWIHGHTSLADITREILTVGAIAGMFWFQIEIVRCFW